MIRERLLGPPEQLDGPRLQLGLRARDEAYAARCLRAAALRDPWDPAPALAALSQSPARRRAAAWSLAWRGAPAPDPALLAAWEIATAHADRLLLSWAMARCGADPGPLRARLSDADLATLSTWSGPKQPNVALDQPPLAEQFDALISAPSPADLRARLLADLRAPSPTRLPDLLRRLALLGHPDDLPLLEDRLSASGRREEHAIHRALALLGDPRAAPRLLRLLSATDADPGRGFVQRRIAAAGLGRLALADTLPAMLRALDAERHDFEGRPGAGLGVQFPVRGELLLALGEFAASAAPAIPALVAHLDDTTGSALGGFYLPAAEALLRVGPAALPALRQRAASPPTTGAANAEGVLRQLLTLPL